MKKTLVLEYCVFALEDFRRGTKSPGYSQVDLTPLRCFDC